MCKIDVNWAEGFYHCQSCQYGRCQKCAAATDTKECSNGHAMSLVDHDVYKDHDEFKCKIC